MKLWDIVGIANFLFYGILKLAAKLLALLVVPFMDDDQRVHDPVLGCEDATDLSYWNIAIRNGAHNFAIRDRVDYQTFPHPHPDETLEKLDGYQWRFRRSLSGNYLSFRCTWGEPRPAKGKREFYIGWTMNETPRMRPTLQVRL